MDIDKILQLLFDETPVSATESAKPKKPTALDDETSANFDREIKNIKRNFSGESSIDTAPVVKKKVLGSVVLSPKDTKKLVGGFSKKADESRAARGEYEVVPSKRGSNESSEEKPVRITVGKDGKPKVLSAGEADSDGTVITAGKDGKPKVLSVGGADSDVHVITAGKNGKPRLLARESRSKKAMEGFSLADAAEAEDDIRTISVESRGDASPRNIKYERRGDTVLAVETTKTELPEGSDYEVITFDEDAFAELVGAEAGDVGVLFVEETEEEEEHLEITYTIDGEEVLIKVNGDGEVSQIVNAEIEAEPKFEASFAPTLDEDDKEIEGDITLTLSLVEEENEETDGEELDLPKTEEDVVADSEEDNDTEDEEGNKDSEEYVDPAGLDLDEYYSTTHKMRPASNAGNNLKGNVRSHTVSQEDASLRVRPKTVRK
jgi:hypothetical protein